MLSDDDITMHHPSPSHFHLGFNTGCVLCGGPGEAMPLPRSLEWRREITPSVNELQESVLHRGGEDSEATLPAEDATQHSKTGHTRRISVTEIATAPVHKSRCPLQRC